MSTGDSFDFRPPLRKKRRVLHSPVTMLAYWLIVCYLNWVQSLPTQRSKGWASWRRTNGLCVNLLHLFEKLYSPQNGRGIQYSKQQYTKKTSMTKYRVSHNLCNVAKHYIHYSVIITMSANRTLERSLESPLTRVIVINYRLNFEYRRFFRVLYAILFLRWIKLFINEILIDKKLTARKLLALQKQTQLGIYIHDTISERTVRYVHVDW